MNEDLLSNLRTIITISMIGAVIGVLYTQVVYLSRPDAEGSIWIGFFIGSFVSGLSAVFEIFAVNRPESRIRALPFLASLFVRIVSHLVLIIVTILCVQSVFNAIAGTRIFLIGSEVGDTATDIIFSMLVLFVVVFWMQMRSFIGSRTLKNLIVGKYNKPQQEERIFMIIDILDSTMGTQKIGDSKFHSYLNRLFILFDEVIHKYGGEVHSYVGDAIFVMWPFENDPKRNERVLKLLRALDELCERKRDAIIKEFGLSPSFRAVIHGGPIVVGEMGHRKRQITYLGNTLNLTGRLENLSKELDIPYLVSDEVMSKVKLPEKVSIKPLGEKAVKGSTKKLAVYQILIEA